MGPVPPALSSINGALAAITSLQDTLNEFGANNMFGSAEFNNERRPDTTTTIDENAVENCFDISQEWKISDAMESNSTNVALVSVPDPSTEPNGNQQ